MEHQKNLAHCRKTIFRTYRSRSKLRNTFGHWKSKLNCGWKYISVKIKKFEILYFRNISKKAQKKFKFKGPHTSTPLILEMSASKKRIPKNFL